MILIPSLENSAETNDILALWPPRIPLLITPIGGNERYDGGLGNLASDLRVIVDPWLNNAVGEKCELYWDDDVTPIETQSIDTEEQLTQPFLFNVPKGQIQGGTAFPIFYRVTASSGNKSDSNKLKVLVKSTLPGGTLSKPEDSGHPGLRYTFITNIEDGVDGEIAKQGVVIRIEPYENITVFDRIVARWGDEEQVIYYPVTAEQIRDPQNNPILITFDEQLIKRAGDGKHNVTYQVIDRCGNRPHANAPWSIATNVSVNLNRIPAPTVTGEQEGVLDPAYLKTIVVVASGIGLIEGDRVRVHWLGRVERETAPLPYPGSGKLEFPISLTWVNESNEHPVSITLRVVRTAPDLISDPKSVFIKTTIDLNRPKVLEAYGTLGDRLKMADIYHARHVTVQVDQYLGMAIGQTIRARWASTRNTYDSAITIVDTVGPMDFYIPRLEVVDAIGSTVPISFTVRTFPDGPLHRSDALKLAVDAQGFVLTPPRLTPDLTTVTIRYSGMATGYQARVRLAGVVTRKTAWQDLTTGVTAEFSIPASWIEENKGKTVLINYSVNRPNIDEHSMFSQVLRVQLQ